MNMFKKVDQVKIDTIDMQIQRVSVDCGIFTVAVATVLANGNDPAALVIDQEKMRQSLESGILTAFSTQH